MDQDDIVDIAQCIQDRFGALIHERQCRLIPFHSETKKMGIGLWVPRDDFGEVSRSGQKIDKPRPGGKPNSMSTLEPSGVRSTTTTRAPFEAIARAIATVAMDESATPPPRLVTPRRRSAAILWSLRAQSAR